MSDPEPTGMLCNDEQAVEQINYDYSILRLARSIVAKWGKRRRLSADERLLLDTARETIARAEKGTQ